MKMILNEIGRLVGIILFWVGLCCFAYYDPIAISTVVAALFIMPTTFYFVFKSTEFTESIRVLAIVFFLCLPAYGWIASLVGHPIESKNQVAMKQFQQTQQQKEKELKRYYDNKAKILKGIKHYYDIGNYRFAYAHANEFVYTKDPELMELHEKSKQKMIERGEYKEEEER